MSKLCEMEGINRKKVKLKIMIGNKIIVLLTLIISTSEIARAQTILDPGQRNVITTAVPFLTIDANAQSLGSGSVGVVASDLYSHNGLEDNPAMLSRGKKILGFQCSYVPWLRTLVPNVYLIGTGYYHSIDKNNTIGLSARFFSLGEIQFTDETGNPNGNARPFETAIAFKYAHNFSEYFSIGTGIKYVHSDLTRGGTSGGRTFHPGRAIAGDLGFDYRRDLFHNDYFNLRWNAGLAFLNLGNKLTHSSRSESDFLPQTVKLGNLFTLKCKIKNNNYIAGDLSYQASKLLVPTPSGINPDASPLQGAFQSFYDAPGGFNEESREIIHQFGTESRISFADNKILIALRGGYFHEHSTKGGRKFVTIGSGLGIAGFRLDLAYLLPTQQRHPMQNTFAVSLGGRFNLDGKTFFRFTEQ